MATGKQPAPAAPAVEAVEEIDGAAARFLDAGRAAMGVDGNVQGFWATLRARRVGLYGVVALGLLAVVDSFQGNAFVILGPEISRGLGLDRAILGVLLLVSTLATTLAALPMAAYVESRPRRALVAKVTGILWSVATLFTGFATNGLWMGAVLTIDGATTGSVGAVHEPLLMDIYPTEVRARIISIYYAFLAFTGVASPLLVAALAGPLDLTWRGVFLVLGSISVVVALTALGLRDPGFGRWDTSRLRAEVRGGAVAAGRDQDEYRLRFFEILRRLMVIPTLRRVLFAFAVAGMLLVPLNTYFVFFLEERWGLGPAQRGLFFSVLPVVSIASVLVFSRLNERLFHSDPARLFRLAAGLQIVALLLYGVALFSPFFWLLVVGFAAGAAVQSTLTPALVTGYLSVVRPQMRPHASALAGIFQVGVGGFAGLVLLSGLQTRYGISGAIVSICIPGVISGLVLRSAASTVNGDLDRTVEELVEEEELATLASRNAHLPMLVCRRVNFSYGQVQVLFDVDLTVDEGEMVALLGTNGAGKSTLLRVISGLGIPSRGSVRFQGGDVTFLDVERRVRMGISQVPSGHAVYGALSVIDNLRVQGFSYGRNKREVDRRIDEAMATFPRLAERRNQPAATLSGGEQQMLGLSKAIIMRPRLLLIDELSLGLAPRIVAELLTMVRAINQAGTAIVLVEQSVNVALSVVDHAYFMEKGEMRFDGRAEDLVKRGDLLRSVFLEGASRGIAAGAGGRRGAR